MKNIFAKKLTVAYKTNIREHNDRWKGFVKGRYIVFTKNGTQKTLKRKFVEIDNWVKSPLKQELMKLMKFSNLTTNSRQLATSSGS